MRSREGLLHPLLVTALLILLVGIPVLTHFDIFRSHTGPDAVSGATIELPDQPSGKFLVVINSDLHKESISDWRKFFSGEDLPVIFDDIRCIAAKGDASGIQLAERFRILLPENQMTLRQEDPTLFISKVEEGYIDVAMMSAEMADALGFKKEALKDDLILVQISGGS